MSELMERMIPRLSDEERRIMSLPTVQLAMLDCTKGVLIENREKAAPSTMRSLRARGLALRGRDAKSGVMPLTKFGERMAEYLAQVSA